MYAAQAVMLGHRDIVVAGGMESMSNAPFYVDGKIRKGLKFGNEQVRKNRAKFALNTDLAVSSLTPFSVTV